MRSLVIIAFIAITVSLCDGAASGASSHRLALPTATKTSPGNPFATAVVRRYLAGRQGDIDAAVYSRNTGRTYCYRRWVREDTASIVKVEILSTLLAEHQAAHRPLSEQETDLATTMIENSNNDSASDLWEIDGGAPAIRRFDKRIGMRATTPNDDDYWGLTTTTACDQVVLLRHLAYPNPVLDPASRSYELRLMSRVESDQRWGVTGGVPAGVAVSVKNGWLPVGRGWQINSDGYIHGDGRNYVASVMTDDDPSESYGIETIEDLSELLWSLERR